MQQNQQAMVPDVTRGDEREVFSDVVSLDTLFLKARTHNVWTQRRVDGSLIEKAWEIAAFAPTAFNGQPLRLVVLATTEAKERLRPALSPANIVKTMTAPVTLIVAYDLAFFEKLPHVFGHAPAARKLLEDNRELATDTAVRNSTIQGAYLCLALRALGLDVGSMSGFDGAMVDAEFFAGTTLRSNWLMNVGYGDETQLFPRGPRLTFDEVATVL